MGKKCLCIVFRECMTKIMLGMLGGGGGGGGILQHKQQVLACCQMHSGYRPSTVKKICTGSKTIQEKVKAVNNPCLNCPLVHTLSPQVPLSN